MSNPTTVADIFTVDPSVLKAALICVGDHPGLQGIHFDPAGWVVATDGHRLFAGRLRSDSPLPERGFTVPTASVKAALAKRDLVVAVQQGEIAGEPFVPLDQAFPDWRMVVPKTCSGVLGQFDGKYLGDLSRIAKLLNGTTQFHQYHNGGSGPSVIAFQDREDFAVLMPFHSWAAHKWKLPPNFKKPKQEKTTQ